MLLAMSGLAGSALVSHAGLDADVPDSRTWFEHRADRLADRSCHRALATLAATSPLATGRSTGRIKDIRWYAGVAAIGSLLAVPFALISLFTPNASLSIWAVCLPGSSS